MTWILFDERYRDLIPDYDHFLLSLEKDLPVGLRVNKLKAAGDSFLEMISQRDGFELHRVFPEFSFYHVGGPRKHWGGKLEHHLGLYYIQALSSLLPVAALGATPGESVLDMCSAPGGKSAFLAEKMKSQGPLICNEPDLNRRRVLKANLERMGVTNAAVFDALGEELPFKDGAFDRILLDGPCSSEGTFRRVDTRKRKSGHFIKYNRDFRRNLQAIQFSLLSKAVALLRPGGSLVYSTCTYDPDENEGQVNRVLKEFPQMKLVPTDLSLTIEEKLVPGCTSYQGTEFDPSLRHSLRVYPHKLDSIGFYLAKFTKLK